MYDLVPQALEYFLASYGQLMIHPNKGHLMPHASNIPFNQTVMLPVMGWIAALLLAGLSQAATATLHKCPGADGKVEFSDRACHGASTSSPARPTQPTAARKTDSNDDGNRAKCVKMRDRIANLLAKGTGNTPQTEVRALVSQYEAQCAEIARQEVSKQDAKDAAASAPVRLAQDAARCNTMRKELETLQLEQQALVRQGTPLTPAQTQQRSAFTASVTKECS
jgi:hypothetical protein